MTQLHWALLDAKSADVIELEIQSIDKGVVRTLEIPLLGLDQSDEDGGLEKARTERYAGWSTPKAQAMLNAAHFTPTGGRPVSHAHAILLARPLLCSTAYANIRLVP